MLLFDLIACAHTAAPLEGAGVAPAVATVAPLDEGSLATLLENPGDTTLVVNFWATWCGPCRAEMATFARAAAANPDVRFALVSVDDAGDDALVARFVADEHIPLPVYHLHADDPAEVLARRVPGWADVVPMTLVIAPGGAVRATFPGLLDAGALDRALGPVAGSP